MFQVVVLAACAVLGQAETPPAPASDELSPQVQRLVRQLESDARLDRDRAQEALIKLGASALDLLPQHIEKARTQEAKHRLEQVQATLQTQFAEQFAQARPVTLKADARPLSEVLAELQRQTGNPIVDYRTQFNQEASDPKLTVDFSGTPFWQAMDAVLDQAQLTIYAYTDKPGLAIVSRPADSALRSGQAEYLGAFRLQATRAVAERDLRQGADRALRLTLELAWESRLAPISLVMPMEQVQAVDDQGREIAVAGPRAEWEIPVRPGQSQAEFPLPFALPPRDTLKIASLKGRIVAVTPSKTELFKFDDVANKKNVEQRRAGVTVTLDEMRKNHDVWEVRIHVRFDQTFGALESHRGWIFENDAQLQDADGKVIQHGGLEKTSQSQDEVGLAYLFNLPNGPAGHSFVYKTPAAILRLPIEFQLKDVELP